ncbi:MAG: prephenate dehydrogenase/arogenate dehydrogenase family protein [Patescibacteria group bacterium]|jgi:prephenate dehydratase/prephenate dehydrogenase
MQKLPIIGIIGGRGILGKIFRANFAAAGFEVLVAGRKPDGREILTTDELIRRSDIVIVSVFLSETEKVLRAIVPKMRANQLLADFTSVKEMPVKIMRAAKSEVVGLHPMFGEVASLRGKNIFAVVARGGKLWKILRQNLADFGLKIHEVSAEKHDELAALHQSAAHLLALTFAQILRKNKIAPEKIFEIASPSTQLFLLTTGRILGQNLEMYADISLANPKAAKTIRELAEILNELATAVEMKNRAKLLANFEAAAKFFGKWSEFANTESSRIFESLAPQTQVKKTQLKTFPKNSIGILGKNTQTELAAKDFLFLHHVLKGAHLLSFSTISEIFAKVSTTNHMKFGFVPLENSTVGLVRETMLNLFESNGKIRILAEFEKKIEHALLAPKKLKLTTIEKVFAHPQAAAQSAKFLAQKLPHAEIIAVENAGRALGLAQTSPNSAAITAAEFAKNGFKILAKNIEDSKENKTRFVAIGKNNILSSKNSKKSAIAFFFRENRAGQLAAALNIFAAQKINLARLESIPTAKKRGEFFFFIEVERTKNLPAALTQLQKIANVVELGSY